MTKKIISRIAALTAAASIVSVLPVIPSAAYDDSFSVDVNDNDCFYCPGYSTGSVDVRAEEQVVNPDTDKYLFFSITNRTDRTIFIPSPVSEQCFVQKRTAEGWVTVYGNEYSAVPLGCEDVSCYDYGGTCLSPYLTITESLDVSDFEDGEYRMGFFTDYCDLHHLYFTVRRSVSVLLAESRLFTDENELEVRVSNNLPYDVELNLDPSLTVLEKYSGGSWNTVEPEEYPEFYENPVLSPYGSDSFTVDLECFGKLTKGEYRLSFDWNAYDMYDTDAYSTDVYGSCRVNFRIADPVSLSIIPMSADSRTELLARVKITNNTDSRIYIRDYGRLKKKSGNRWLDVSFRNGAKELSNYKSVAPGKTTVLELKLSDYYYIKPLNSTEYRMEIPVNDRSYYCDFTVSRDVYYTIK